MGLADLHVHTVYSKDGTASVEAIVRYVAQFTDLDVIAITDHDEIAGALEAVKLGKKYGVSVVVASEVTTREGHLLALFLQEKVPAGMSLVETTLCVREQGGLCIIPHPLAINAQGVNEASLINALRDPEVPEVLVALETYNAGLIYRSTNDDATELARRMLLPGVGASDAHILWPIGSGATAFVGKDAQDLYAALQAGAVIALRRQILPQMRLVKDWLGQFVRRPLALSGRFISSN